MNLAASDPDEVCGGTFEYLDSRVAGLQDVFGEASYASVDYYWVPDLWYDQPWCREPASGCAVGNRVYSEYVPHDHELTHAIRRDGLPAVFEEGLAEMFGDLGWTSEPSPRENLRGMLESSSIQGLADYARASHFVAFLVEQYGIDPFVTFAVLGDRDDEYSEVSRDFESAFGLTLEQALDAYDEFPDCNPAAWTDRRIPCANPGIPLAPGIDIEVGLSLDLDCSSSDVLGPFSNFMFTETTLEVEPMTPAIPVWLYLVGDLSPDTSALLVSCDTTCSNSTVKWLDDELPGEYLDLPPGRYVLRVFRPVDDPGTVGLTMWQ